MEYITTTETKKRNRRPWTTEKIACNIRMPKDLDRRLMQEVRARKISKNALIVEVVANYFKLKLKDL